ncbi:MAG TPA: RdgB/HAM1 family non-canonical purine NTP pyrophosphatase [Arenimonas sp.]|nr:RdgB/HAM1 family non-canonical purine NTP pyrophosphatase [Arenimonas sp.]HOZ04071.1 RdgB/HAM1 family non-canonical purine NTP pyrophosphatase [Arenimonas sp.]HPO23517.1 RdgB/HAM1 family non-canonical purine NTP pyrophosphatase [Arenimonas sp.]HPW31546.1 RdgB/HAM1 family non-canonical purine NTP pyrophosphatase [Arenimonas sp.]
MKKLVLATSNRGKVIEMQPLLSDIGYTIITQTELGVSDAIEDGHTFVENALIKARHASASTGLPAIADDSGLIIDALNGAPGLISAHYAGVHGDAKGNIAKVLAELKGIPKEQRSARFYSLIVMLKHADDPQPLIAEGIWEGEILESPRGENGFGYDPIFFVREHQCSAAELSADIKNHISHRGRALLKLRELLNARINS